MRKIIHETQSAFVGGTRMMDGVVISNEIVHERKVKKKKKRSCCIIKVDFEKVYDLVFWEFLFYMMERMSFNKKWIGRIKACLKYFAMSISVNRSK